MIHAPTTLLRFVVFKISNLAVCRYEFASIPEICLMKTKIIGNGDKKKIATHDFIEK
jgi:hypothetical protein